jgi:hypothetical protein
MMFDRIDLDLQHPDGRVERVVVLHQMITPALAALDEFEEAKRMGCEARIAAPDMPIAPRGPARGGIPIDLLDRIRRRGK